VYQDHARNHQAVMDLMDSNNKALKRSLTQKKPPTPVKDDSHFTLPEQDVEKSSK
jgi:hypothetical protein